MASGRVPSTATILHGLFNDFHFRKGTSKRRRTSRYSFYFRTARADWIALVTEELVGMRNRVLERLVELPPRFVSNAHFRCFIVERFARPEMGPHA